MANIENDDIKEVKTKAPVKAVKEVEILVPRADDIKGENFMIVGDNGKYYKLKRGARVKVPQSVADIIESSEARKEAAREYLEKLMNE